MKKLIIFMIVLFAAGLSFASEYEISVRDYRVTKAQGRKYVIFDLGYKMKNTGNETVFLYDLRRKYEIFSPEKNSSSLL